MEMIYGFLETLPVSMFQYDFMKNAFLASILIAPLFALLGTMAVNFSLMLWDIVLLRVLALAFCWAWKILCWPCWPLAFSLGWSLRK